MYRRKIESGFGKKIIFLKIKNLTRKVRFFIYQFCYTHYFRNSFFKILPVALMGKAAKNSTWRGYL